ncbi:MAG: transglycosylase SLT domain-containing protein [Janthinobacterium lividum]
MRPTPEPARLAARRRDGHTGVMRTMLHAGIFGAILALHGAVAAPAPEPDRAACGTAIDAAERTARTAPGLLAAIGVVESGRTDLRTGARRPWPWTINAEGVGTYFPSKTAAITAVQALQARGVQSVDVGCMQVNLMHHPQAFRTLEDAFDPRINAAYAARFLNSLRARTADWPAAAAAYHSFTPERGAQYARLIAAVWSGAPVPVSPGAGGAEVVSFPDGGQLRIFREAAGPGRSGRVLGYLSGP